MIIAPATEAPLINMRLYHHL